MTERLRFYDRLLQDHFARKGQDWFSRTDPTVVPARALLSQLL